MHHDIIKYLKTYYGIDVTKLSKLPFGADIHAAVYKADSRDQSYFVKLKFNSDHDVSIAILDLLHKAGIQQIIPPLKTIHGQSTQHINDITLIVHPFIEGQNGFARALTQQQWITLGKVLKQIHELTVPVAIQQQIRRETYSSKWRDIVRSFYQRIHADPVGDAIALQLLTFMKLHLSTIQRLVDRADTLAHALKTTSQQFVLCHADLHGGNVIANDNAIYIVDWDDPIMAPVARDLMFIGGGVGNVWNKSSEEESFYKGYGKPKMDIKALAYYRHERIVEDIAVYTQQILLSDDENREEMYHHFLSMFIPEGVVDKAFATDAKLQLF